MHLKAVSRRGRLVTTTMGNRSGEQQPWSGNGLLDQIRNKCCYFNCWHGAIQYRNRPTHTRANYEAPIHSNPIYQHMVHSLLNHGIVRHWDVWRKPSTSKKAVSLNINMLCGDHMPDLWSVCYNTRGTLLTKWAAGMNNMQNNHAQNNSCPVLADFWLYLN